MHLFWPWKLCSERVSWTFTTSSWEIEKRNIQNVHLFLTRRKISIYDRENFNEIESWFCILNQLILKLGVSKSKNYDQVQPSATNIRIRPSTSKFKLRSSAHEVKRKGLDYASTIKSHFRPPTSNLTSMLMLAVI